MRAGAAQKALGFIMTVYRRRLTSSFLAIELSLQRRLGALLGKARVIDLLTPDDLASLEETGALDLDALEGPALALAREVEELRDFLADLGDRPPQESKMERLRDDLLAAFRGVHDTAVVFTQYTDTMRYLREQLVPTFRDRLICYSGDGGERWDPNTGRWVPVTKQRVRELFEKGEEVKMLLGTDALSEGLNLQSSGRLINYDCDDGWHAVLGRA
ncbi:MAG: helicase-related protein [Candidatus Limnocylindrales bacterium]